MSARTNLITGEPILFAPGRASRPGAFVGGRPPERCPFCAGHEEDTPPALAVTGDPWRVRVVPNKYPPVAGAEVIIESPEHTTPFHRIEHREEILRVTIDRYRAHEAAAYTAVFKNEGPDGGASIPHVHSQVMPVSFIPPRIARESNAFGNASTCPICRAIETHRQEGLMIRETDGFAWFAPSSSGMPWQLWIAPKDHAPEMVALDARRIEELAVLLRASSGAMRTMSASFNWMFLNFPHSNRAHWYLDLFPRMTTIAGFELSTGTFVEIVDPAAAALHFREGP